MMMVIMVVAVWVQLQRYHIDYIVVLMQLCIVYHFVLFFLPFLMWIKKYLFWSINFFASSLSFCVLLLVCVPVSSSVFPSSLPADSTHFLLTYLLGRKNVGGDVCITYKKNSHSSLSLLHTQQTSIEVSTVQSRCTFNSNSTILKGKNMKNPTYHLCSFPKHEWREARASQ